jgi:hypothetical protein
MGVDRWEEIERQTDRRFVGDSNGPGRDQWVTLVDTE